MLAARTKLAKLRQDLDNQMRGLCKGLGIVLGKAGSTNRPTWLAESTPCSLKHRICSSCCGGRGEPSRINRIYRLCQEEWLTVRKRWARRKAVGTVPPVLIEARPTAR